MHNELFYYVCRYEWRDKLDLSLTKCPSHYPPTEPLFLHNSEPLYNSNLLAILFDCKKARSY